MTNDRAIQIADVLLCSFAHGVTDKWDLYAGLFGMMDDRDITLQQIADAAQKYQISARTINARRKDYLAMGGQQDPFFLPASLAR